MRRLHWKRDWSERVGDYESFVERCPDALRLVRCPAPHGALVLPAQAPTTLSSGWSGGDKYVAWCHGHRLAAAGQAKRKWKHLENMVRRLCRELSCPSTSETLPAAALDMRETNHAKPAKVATGGSAAAMATMPVEEQRSGSNTC